MHRAGHVLIAPLRNAVRYKDLTPEEITDMWVAAQNGSFLVVVVVD
jgi:diadenosine tetraphosphate (Ap4A) HIT family hydrolase